MSQTTARAESTQALVVGGGLAGLYAAWQLKKAGMDCLLLEAAPRLGGRILSQPIAPGSLLGVDLGPMWFWPHQKRLQRLCQALGLRTFEQPTAGDMLYQLASGRAPQRHLDTEAMPSYRLEGGVQSLVTALAARLDAGQIRLAHKVELMARTEGGWRLAANSNGKTLQFEAPRLVFAAPPRQLAALVGAQPGLPPRLHEALRATPTWMAAQAKFVAVYESAFWRRMGLAGQAFSRIGPMVEIHDASSTPSTGHALFGFVGLGASQRRQLRPEMLKAACLEQLVALFGDAAATPLSTHLKDWADDPAIASPQDLSETPRHPDLNLAPWLGELRRLKLDLAGSEFAAEDAGYLEGALYAVDTIRSGWLARTA